MATRIGIIAALNSSVDEVAAVLGSREVPVCTTGPWTWSAFSLWAVALGHLDSNAIHERLRGIAGPWLHITTVDDELWRITAAARGYPEIEASREHEQLARRKPNPQFLQDSQQLARQLVELGIPADELALRDVLLGIGATEPERDLPLGNLPRFLKTIGLTEVFSELEDDDDDGENGEEEEIEDAPTAIWNVIRSLEPVPVRDGPWTVDISMIAQVWCLAWFCDTDVQPLWIVANPASPIRLPKLKPSQAEVRHEAGEIRIALPWQPATPMRRFVRQVVQSLVALPDGTQLELATGHVVEEGEQDEPVPTAGNQRYCGAIRDGQWKLDRAYPAVDVPSLNAAMELCAQIDGKKAFVARDPAEAAEVVRLAGRSQWFGNDLPKARGAIVSVKPHLRMHLAMMFFRLRFPDVWNVREGQQSDEQIEAQWNEAIEGIGAAANRLFSAPTSGEVVLEGQGGVFRRADMAHVSEANPFAGLAELFGDPLEDPQTVAERLGQVDAEMARAGFSCLGDMVCDRAGDVVIRGYGQEDSDSVGVLMVGTLGQWVYEFFTRFSDGSTLTTTTHPVPKEGGKYRKISCEQASVAELWARHQAEVADRLSARRKASPAPATLHELAEAMDEYLVRELGPA